MFGMNYVIFRPHNVYGEYQNLGDRYRNVVGIFMNQLMQDKPLTIFGDGNQSRAFSYVGDIAPTIANCINFPHARNQTFNIGADIRVTVNDLASEVCKAMGKAKQIRYVDARNEVEHAYSSHEKAKEAFGHGGATSLPEGLIKMAKWAKENGARQSQKFNNIEINKNLPSIWLE